MKQTCITFIILCWSVSAIFAQESSKKVKPFIKTGYGYFSDEFMIDGTCFSAEVGIIQPNKFSLSLHHYKAVTLNDKGDCMDMGLVEYYMYNNYDATTFYTGYHMVSKNNKHAFIPKLGLFYGTERFVYPSFNNQNQGIMAKSNDVFIGFALNAGYQYKITKNFSIGLSGSVYYAYQYGFMNYLLQPEICITID